MVGTVLDKKCILDKTQSKLRNKKKYSKDMKRKIINVKLNNKDFIDGSLCNLKLKLYVWS